MLSQNDVELFIRQGPERARVATGKEKGSQLIHLRSSSSESRTIWIQDSASPLRRQTLLTGRNYLQSPYLIMVVSLYEAHTDHSPSGTPDQLISGTLVSSLHRLKDVDNSDGAFFVFGDLSVKVEGQYRLCFTLHEISNVKDIISEPFTGMAESTFLSRSFGDQGVRLRIRKEARNSMAKRPQQPPPMSMQQPDQYGHYYQQQMQGHMIHQQGAPYGAPHPHSHPHAPPPPQQYAGFVDDRTKRQRFDYPPDPRDQYQRYPDQRPPYPGYPPISQPPGQGYPQYSAPPPNESPYAYPGQHSSPATSPYESPGQPHARLNMPPLRHDMPPPPPPIHIGQGPENRYPTQLPPVSSLSAPNIPASLPPATTLPPPIPSFGRSMPPSSYGSYPALASPTYPGGSQSGQGISLPPLQVPNHGNMGPSSPLGAHSSSSAPGPPTSFDSAVQRVSPPRDYAQR